MFRELVINKVPKFCKGIFSSCKAKNAGDVAHQRVFLMQQEGKRTSKMGRLVVTNSLNTSPTVYIAVQSLLETPFSFLKPIQPLAERQKSKLRPVPLTR
jgi:hypothetical protein